MFNKKKTECRVCGYRFTPERENIYTAEEPRSVTDMLTKAPTRFSAVDCPVCSTLQIVEAVHSVLEKTPPELAADVADRGIVLTGGGSLLRGLEELIEEKTGINTMTAEQPMTCVAIVTGKYVEFLAGKRDEEF